MARFDCPTSRYRPTCPIESGTTGGFHSDIHPEGCCPLDGSSCQIFDSFRVWTALAALSGAPARTGFSRLLPVRACTTLGPWTTRDQLIDSASLEPHGRDHVADVVWQENQVGYPRAAVCAPPPQIASLFDILVVAQAGRSCMLFPKSVDLAIGSSQNALSSGHAATSMYDCPNSPKLTCIRQDWPQILNVQIDCRIALTGFQRRVHGTAKTGVE